MLALGSVASPVNFPPSLWRCKHLRKGAAWRGRCSSHGAEAIHRKAVAASVRCSSDGEGEVKEEEEGRSLEGQVEKMVGGGDEGWSLKGQVQKMLGDEESKALIEDLNAAVERVAKARRDLDALDQQQRRISFTESLSAADSLVEECQRNVFAAELEAKNAKIALLRARAGSSIIDLEEEEGGIDRDVERVESGKAAGVAGVVGTLAGLPFFSAMNLDGVELALSAGIVFVSSCVFGLTYRYAVRRDLRNTQLKAGCVAAFALVRSLDAVRLLATFLPENASQLVLEGCLFFGESITIFTFAAVSLEYCFRQGFVSPFPSKP